MPWNVVEAKGKKDFRQELREAHSGRSTVIMEVQQHLRKFLDTQGMGDLKNEGLPQT